MRYHTLFCDICSFFEITCLKLICNQVSMSRFAHLLGTRVGEAGHPGPNDVSIPVDTHDDYVKIAVINPTAVYNK